MHLLFWLYILFKSMINIKYIANLSFLYSYWRFYLLALSQIYVLEIFIK